MSYVELFCKSNFTFLTGASHPAELVEEAIRLQLPALAINDVNGVYGLAKAFREARQKINFRLLSGAEFKIADHSDIMVLAKTREGFGQMTQMLTHAHAGKEKGKAQLSVEEFLEGFQSYSSREVFVFPRNPGKAELGKLKDLFGASLQLPLTRYLDGHDSERTAQALSLSAQFQIPLVATNDVYYHAKERKELQDVLIAIRENKPIKNVGYKLFSNGERYLKSPAQMEKLFADQPQALKQTLRIAEECPFVLSELRYYYPSEWIPPGLTAQAYLEELVWKHARERYKQGYPAGVEKQLNHELSLIHELKFADYFLTIYDIVEFAKRHDILCQGRGSAANSIVCYVLGITAIDPIEMKLLFERFLSAERGEPPDIDIDFEHERREEVIQYIYDKYGRDRAAMVSAVITYRGRNALREVCKAFDVPVGTLSAKKVGRQFDELLAQAEGLNLKEKILRNTDAIQGFPRHLSIHSGGFTLSAQPITAIVPVEPARMENRSIIQWDKYDLDELGLLKVDVLSLGMLSALKKTLDSLKMKLYEVPIQDKATYDMIQQADTVGVFQIESRAQMSMLGRLLPEKFYDLVVEVAIVRPGPIVGDMVHPYLKRRRGLEKITYPNKKVENILGRTMGVPLFQEQIMKLAIELAGFTPGESDRLRKAIGAWRSAGPISVIGERLMQGLIQGGLPQSFADQIFKQIQGFSEYGFPESHAASFALLAYVSSYLKCHHPAEFTCALVNSQPMGFYRVDTLLYDAIRHGVEVLPVDVNISEWDCKIEDKKIRLGFRLIKGLAKKDALNMLEERKRGGRFENLPQVLRRTHLRQDVLARMSLADQFQIQDSNPRRVLWQLLEYQNYFAQDQKDQLSFFFQENFKLHEEDSFAPLNSFEKIQMDYSAFHLSTHGHPMGALREYHSHIPKTNSAEVKKQAAGKNVEVAGLILVRQMPPTAKSTVFSTIEDEFGFVDLILHKDIYEKNKEVFLGHCFVIVQGKLQKDKNTTSLLVKKIRPVWDTKTLDETPLPIEPDQYFY